MTILDDIMNRLSSKEAGNMARTMSYRLNARVQQVMGEVHFAIDDSKLSALEVLTSEAITYHACGRICDDMVMELIEESMPQQHVKEAKEKYFRMVENVGDEILAQWKKASKEVDDATGMSKEERRQMVRDAINEVIQDIKKHSEGHNKHESNT